MRVFKQADVLRVFALQSYVPAARALFNHMRFLQHMRTLLPHAFLEVLRALLIT